MSFTGTDYTFSGTASFGAPGQNYQVVAALPTPTAALAGTLFYVKGPPDALWVLRANAQGSLVYAKIDGRVLALHMSEANFTPAGTGIYLGGLAIVPYDASEPGLVSIAWTVVDIVFRMESAASSGSTSLQIQHSTGTGAFANVGYLNTQPVSIPAASYEPTVRPAVISQSVVNSGDKLLPEFTALGSGAAGFTVYVILRETN